MDRGDALASCYHYFSEADVRSAVRFTEVGDKTKYPEDPRKGHTVQMISGAESQGFLQAGSKDVAAPNRTTTWMRLIGLSAASRIAFTSTTKA